MVLANVFAKPGKLFVVNVYPFLLHHATIIPATMGDANEVPFINSKFPVLVYGVLAVQSYFGHKTL